MGLPAESHTYTENVGRYKNSGGADGALAQSFSERFTEERRKHSPLSAGKGSKEAHKLKLKKGVTILTTRARRAIAQGYGV